MLTPEAGRLTESEVAAGHAGPPGGQPNGIGGCGRDRAGRLTESEVAAEILTEIELVASSLMKSDLVACHKVRFR